MAYSGTGYFEIPGLGTKLPCCRAQNARFSFVRVKEQRKFVFKVLRCVSSILLQLSSVRRSIMLLAVISVTACRRAGTKERVPV